MRKVVKEGGADVGVRDLVRDGGRRAKKRSERKSSDRVRPTEGHGEDRLEGVEGDEGDGLYAARRGKYLEEVTWCFRRFSRICTRMDERERAGDASRTDPSTSTD